MIDDSLDEVPPRQWNEADALSSASRSRHATLWIAFLLVLLTTPRAFAWQPDHIAASIGVSYDRPLDSAVHDLYSGAAGVSGGLLVPLPSPLRVELHGQWSRQNGSPQPLLSSNAGSRLTTSPWSLELSLSPPRGKLRPFLLGGTGLIVLRERLTYSLFGEEHRLTGKDVRFAGVAGGGIESRFPSVLLRLTARAYFAGGRREILRPSFPALSDRGSVSTSMFTLGVEVGRAFPLNPATGSR